MKSARVFRDFIFEMVIFLTDPFTPPSGSINIVRVNQSYKSSFCSVIKKIKKKSPRTFM